VIRADGEPADEALLAACQEGDDSAFETLFRRWQRPITAYIQQIVRNYDDAACLTQDVFLKVFEHRASFDTQRRFTTWFYTIARNAAIDFVQSKGRRSAVRFSTLDGDADDARFSANILGTAEAVEQRLAGSESTRLLAAAIADLPDLHREIIELIVFQERSYEDVSEILGGVPLGTLRSRMFHALRRLRAVLAAAGGGEAGEGLL
jgi:RNA polymerase sigma-70 factor, ECF subfamily